MIHRGSITILNNLITFDKDIPWIAPKVKSAIQRNARVIRKWVKRGRKLNDHNKVKVIL